MKQKQYFATAVESIIQKEAPVAARKVCSVVPAALGESIGDYASLGVAFNALDNS